MNNAINVASNLFAVLVSIWLIWRSLRTGILAGNPKLEATRADNPIKFWCFVALFATVAIVLGLRTAGFQFGL